MATATATKTAPNQKWTDAQITASIKKFYKLHKRVPKGIEAEKRMDGLAPKSTIIKHFGTWNKAIEAAGLTPTVAPQFRNGGKPSVTTKVKAKGKGRTSAKSLNRIPVAVELPLGDPEDSLIEVVEEEPMVVWLRAQFDEKITVATKLAEEAAGIERLLNEYATA